jgi:hypothetical protein
MTNRSLRERFVPRFARALVAAALLASPAASQQPLDASTSAPWRDVQGAGRLAWSWTLGTNRTDWITRVIPTRDGSLVAVGFVNRDDVEGATDWDAVAVRFTADGRVLWSKRYGGAGNDAFWDITETAAGHLALAGFSSTGGAGSYDALFTLLDRDGNVVTERRYGGAKSDIAFGIAAAPDGGFLVIGQTESEGAGERDVFLVRTDSLGVERWRRTNGTPGVDRAFFGAWTNGGFAVAGVTGAERSYDILTLKVDDSGEIRWRQVVGGPGNDPNHGLNVLPDGRILVAGYAESWDSRVHDLVALTFSPEGELLRHEVMGGADDDRTMSSFNDGAGGTWLVGYTKSFGAGGWDVMVAHVRPDGSFDPWLGAVGGPHDDQAYGGTLLPGGDLVIGGYTSGPSAGASPPDLLVARFSPDRLTRHTDSVSVRRIR